MHRKDKQLGFADRLIGPGKSKRDRFFAAVNEVVDWSEIEERLGVIHNSRMGRPSITPLLLFKVLLIQRWYNLSDPVAEDSLNDSKAFARFVGLPLDERAPDYSTISRFRTELIRRDLMAPLMETLLAQIDARGLILRQGAVMDATFVVSAAHAPGAPRTRKAKTAASAEPGPPKDPFTAGKLSRIDPDARWGKKGRKAYFGYKLHIAADQGGRRIVRGYRVTGANLTDCEIGPELVQPDGGAHYGDKGYPSQPLRDKLAAHGLADGIMQLPSKHYPLRPAERRRNRILAGIRSEVEGVFGEMKHKLGLVRARYVGLAKVQLQCALTIFAFNLQTMALAAK